MPTLSDSELSNMLNMARGEGRLNALREYADSLAAATPTHPTPAPTPQSAPAGTPTHQTPTVPPTPPDAVPAPPVTPPPPPPTAQTPPQQTPAPPAQQQQAQPAPQSQPQPNRNADTGQFMASPAPLPPQQTAPPAQPPIHDPAAPAPGDRDAEIARLEGMINALANRPNVNPAAGATPETPNIPKRTDVNALRDRIALEIANDGGFRDFTWHNPNRWGVA